MRLGGLTFSGPRAAVQEQEDHWIPLSDLMTGLMMLFMLIAVLFIVKVDADKERLAYLMLQAKMRAAEDQKKVQQVQEVVNGYDLHRERLYNELAAEFKADLPRWGAELDRDLTIRFKEPEVLFDSGAFSLKPKFISILDDFFPRYAKILAKSEYKGGIEEVRIEGHTSSVWSTTVFGDLAYFKNMELSQQRTRATLEHVLVLPSVTAQRSWLISHLTANGLSSSKPRLNIDGSEMLRPRSE
jgi:outer membrane protein OmpA-like peptidoglycan-associated protein